MKRLDRNRMYGDEACRMQSMCRTENQMFWLVNVCFIALLCLSLFISLGEMVRALALTFGSTLLLACFITGNFAPLAFPYRMCRMWKAGFNHVAGRTQE